jgi:hypothetical protein
LTRFILAFQNATDFEPGHLRQHQIKNNQSRPLLSGGGDPGLPVNGRDRFEVSFREVPYEQIDNVLLILNDQDPLANRTHVLSSAALPSGKPCWHRGGPANISVNPKKIELL